MNENARPTFSFSEMNQETKGLIMGALYTFGGFILWSLAWPAYQLYKEYAWNELFFMLTMLGGGVFVIGAALLLTNLLTKGGKENDSDMPKGS